MNKIDEEIHRIMTITEQDKETHQIMTIIREDKRITEDQEEDGEEDETIMIREGEIIMTTDKIIANMTETR